MKMTNSNLMKNVGSIVQVVWGDACSVEEWVPIEEVGVEPLMTTSVGVLVGVGDTALALSGTLNASGHTCGTIVIPLGMINMFEILKPKGAFVA